MFHAVTLSAGRHDVRFVLAAGCICFLAASAALWLRVQKLDDRGAASGLWLPSGALAAGSGIWAADLILFLGYAPVSPDRINFALMAASLGIAALATLGCLGAHRRAALSARAAWTAPLLSGAALGLGLMLVHTVIFAGLRGVHALSPWPLQAAALVAVLALSIASRIAGADISRPARAVMAPALVTLAAAAAHFISVAGDAAAAGPAAARAGQLLARSEMAMATASFALLIILGVGAVALVEARTQQKGLRQLQTATNAMPAALALFDSRGELVIWNTTFALVAGRDAQALGNMRIEDLAAAMAPAGAEPRHHPAGGDRQTLEFPLPDGKWIRVEQVPTEEGGLLSVGIDITEIKRSEEALARALERAEAANRAKSEFLANMSHEIRTPLNGVSGLADVLARTRLSPKQRELVDIIRRSAQTVDGLIGNVLDLASMEAGQARLNRAAFELGDLVRQATGLHRPHAEGKGLRLVEEIEPAAEARVFGDPARLGQVLHSLLSNAVKFTEAGEVRVRVRALDQDRYRLEVADTGVGFDPADRPRLFERFAQGDGSATRRFSGMGLGLALVGECAKLMDASFDCASTPGQGAVFTFELALPAAPAGEAPADAGRGAREETAAEAPLEVLVVDDNATNRRVLELILEQLGAKTHPVENGQEAVEAFEAGRFDLVLMDIQMPVMDGLTATRAIRAHERVRGLPATPVIIVSANCMPEHVQAGLDAGAQQCLPKPINARALVDAISNVLEPSGRQAA